MIKLLKEQIISEKQILCKRFNSGHIYQKFAILDICLNGTLHLYYRIVIYAAASQDEFFGCTNDYSNKPSSSPLSIVFIILESRSVHSNLFSPAKVPS